MPSSIASFGEVGRGEAAAVAMTSETIIRITCGRYGRSRPSSQRTLRARSASPRSSRQTSRASAAAGEPPGRVHLSSSRRDVGALRLVSASSGVDAGVGAHSRASSSRSSRSRCRNSMSLAARRSPRRAGSARAAPRACRVDDPPALHDDDLVGERDRGEPVGDHEGRASLHHLAQRALDLALGGGVDAAVASSRIRIRGSVISARAIAIRCRWPPDSVRPRSPTSVS